MSVCFFEGGGPIDQEIPPTRSSRGAWALSTTRQLESFDPNKETIMETPIPSSVNRQPSAVDSARHEALSSGVSWGGVLGGAFVAAALALILLLLATGLGLSAVSPWSYEGASAKTVGIAAIAWMVFTHLSSSATGGYLAGRLRTSGSMCTRMKYFSAIPRTDWSHGE